MTQVVSGTGLDRYIYLIRCKIDHRLKCNFTTCVACHYFAFEEKKTWKLNKF